MWAAEEVGAEYELVIVNLRRGAGRRPDYLNINPGGKVPALEDDGMILTESAAICTYLGDRFPDSGLVPGPGTVDRARYLQWCFFVVGELEQPLWTMTKHSYALPESLRVADIAATARWEFSRAAGVLAAGLGDQDYILGSHFSAADILIAHTLFWAQAAQLPLEHTDLESYRERLQARPALDRARAREAVRT